MRPWVSFSLVSLNHTNGNELCLEWQEPGLLVQDINYQIPVPRVGTSGIKAVVPSLYIIVCAFLHFNLYDSRSESYTRSDLESYKLCRTKSLEVDFIEVQFRSRPEIEQF